jgi:uncharacterized membrane protein YphA (DoxX/SURF4 family)
MAESASARARWSLPRRIAFRFLFTYFVLFVLTGQEVAQLPLLSWPSRKYTELWYAVAVWLGRHLFHVTRDIPINGDGSGDTTFAWLLLPCYLTLAAAITAVWTALARGRESEERLAPWFRLMLRFSLALAMIGYGSFKMIPSQMPYPRPFMLLQRVGELKPMRLLWTFIGSSPAYETLTGLAELLGGILLLAPRTTLLGALVCCGDMAMVFVLNMCYDVPVKIMSFHYLLMSVILLAPDLPRLADLFVFNRPVEPAAERPLFANRRRALLVQSLFALLGLFTLVESIHQSLAFYRERNPPRPPLYGIWSVEEHSIDGKASADSDPQRWRWVVFQKPGGMSVETVIGSRRGYALDLDLAAGRMTLGKARTDAAGKPVTDARGKPEMLPDGKAVLTVSRPEPTALVLDGVLDGHRTHARLRLVPLLGDRFHWILDPPKE